MGKRPPQGLPCAAGCGRMTLSPRYPFCTTCWRAYRPRKGEPAPEWMKFLVKEWQAGKYQTARDRKRLMSLDEVLEHEGGEEWLQEQCALFGGLWGRRQGGSDE